ncbi:MAG: hypothetical protein IH621_04015 [Krumholzibacteria bacterium]|nr:hypothetical protein [Candidatus Krumholzibacteria bacterium]
MKALMIACALAALLAADQATAEPAAAGDPLDVFKPYCGKTWRGEFTGGDGQAMTDVSRWELVLGGKAVRTVHSLNDGVYGGESLTYWDPARRTLAFVYVTTAGFRTEGTMAVDAAGFTAHEKVIGDPDGVTEVRSTWRLDDDGSFALASEFLKDGQWVPGHSIRYVEAPEAEVRFR